MTAGANLAFVNALLAVTDLGDEVILQTPYYFNHEMAIAMAGCRPVPVDTDDRYQLRPDAIRRAITPRTRAVVTISPNNPSGAVYSEAALREVNEICRQHGLYHINDEAYEYFTYGDARHFSPGSIEGSADHTISLFSLSKAYGFASWRIGYMVIPCASVRVGAEDPGHHSHLRAGHLPVRGRRRAAGGAGVLPFEAGIDRGCARTVLRGARQHPGSLHGPRGRRAPSMYCCASTHLGNRWTSSNGLVRDFGVAVIPGTTFGLNEGCYLRVSYGALTEETAAEGIRRLVRGLRSILGTGIPLG